MMVIFVSQCQKKALAKTRRVLDAFADRIGDNTWQTAITNEGLQAVQTLLKKTATRSTAVSCHWIRSRSRSDLLWVVGRKDAFNYRGVVASNRTRKNILHNEWENDWHYATAIQIIATISALLHDIGKSTNGFQNKLTQSGKIGDPYRHEWISLKLFELMLVDCDTDEQWLERFSHINEWLKDNDLAAQLNKVNADKTNIANLPPLAQWVAWLIMSHHRLPPAKAVFYKKSAIDTLKKHPLSIKQSLAKFYTNISPVDYWVKNPRAFKKGSQKLLNSFWQTKKLVIYSPVWQKNLNRWAKKALDEKTLQQLSKHATHNNVPISDPFLLNLSRLTLMVADHNYSSLQTDDKRRVKGSTEWKEKVVANTDRKTGQIKQSLDEHLLGVASFSAHFARFLPKLTTNLPTLKHHDPLAKNTGVERFKWQNHAFKLARNIQKDSIENGFFGINMASTGCGKTIGDARIMYGLCDQEKGARITIALGLRVLTLQTGVSFRKDLELTDKQLAILVGGTANKKLFEYNQQEEIIEEISGNTCSIGSESAGTLVNEQVNSHIDSSDYSDYEQLNIDTVLGDSKARQLLLSPIITCTIDHIMQASECKRGGSYIPPMLRLLSSDLIFDEPDDFNQEDLPALCRLVHLAGMFGSKVLFSSATLTPDMLAGLYQAYCAGRAIFNNSQNKPQPNIVCAWFDEQNKEMKSAQCKNVDEFTKEHQKFIKKRCQYLQKQPIRRKAEVLPITAIYHKEQKHTFYQPLCHEILQAVYELHNRHHQIEPQSGKKVSIGLLRIANIKHIISLVKQLFTETTEVLPDTHIHVACYHSRQLLVLRNYLENCLDTILKRDDNNHDALFEHADIQKALHKSDAKNHIFIVLGSPVTEVGRDHDYDWAVVEPSSMRSIIQLAGRVWRHRPTKTATHANIKIMQYNIRYLTNNGSNPVFIYPGFETTQFKPSSYDMNTLLVDSQLQRIDAQPRINNKHDGSKEHTDKNKEITTLAELEHRVMKHTLNNSKINYVNAYWSTTATAHKANTHLQQLSPFRQQLRKQKDWILVPNDDSENGFDAYYAESIYENGLQESSPQNREIRKAECDFAHSHISPWLTTSITKALSKLQDYEDLGINGLATRYATVSLDEINERNSNNWYFSEFIGFERE